jgi:acyl dehydratase
MALDKKFIGRKYGPFHYDAGLEKMREFALAVGGGIPSTGFSAAPAPEGLNPLLHDKAAGKASKYGSIIAMPNFAVAFAIGPFAGACTDPELKVNLLMLVHGEQEFEFFEPVKPGDVLTTTGEIAEIYGKNDLDFLVVTSTTVNQRGATVVKGRWNAVIRLK